jgi:hypothetical protein
VEAVETVIPILVTQIWAVNNNIDVMTSVHI